MKNLFLIFFFFLLSFCAAAQVIVTAVGGGGGGDGGPGLHSFIGQSYGVTLDDSGNLYICGEDGFRIRKVAPAYGGIISTIAGTGVFGYSGDGGPGILAQIWGVYDLAVDRHGNVYLADVGNSVIRKVTPTDTITTIAGTNVAGYNGDGIHADSALLNGPEGIAVDTLGNIYIADLDNFRIRKIDTGGIINTVVGTGIDGFTADGARADTAKIRHSWFVRVDKKGNVYFIDSNLIRKIDATGIITTIAGNGITGYSGESVTATSAAIEPAAFALDTAGNIYIADGLDSRVREVVGGMIYTIAGTGINGYSGDYGPPLLAKMHYPAGVAINAAGEVFISDNSNQVVRLITKDPLLNLTNTVPQFESLAVFPNPCSDHCALQINSSYDEPTDIAVSDVTGREVCISHAYTNQSFEIRPVWSPGVYIVIATTAHLRIVQRIIVQ